MGLGDRSWIDKRENYADSYSVSLAGNLVTAMLSTATSFLKQPVVIYSITVSLNPSTASGEVAFMDTSSSAAADAVSASHRIRVSTGASFHREDVFPRGIVFENGVIVSAAAVSGAINVTYKARYS